MITRGREKAGMGERTINRQNRPLSTTATDVLQTPAPAASSEQSIQP